MYQILVVDDSVLDVDCITFLIKKYELPLEVATAVNGQDALELFRKPENHYDILFTDIRMPFLDGLGLSKEVRKLSPNTRIIISAASMILSMPKPPLLSEWKTI